jgi:hypothetical protein
LSHSAHINPTVPAPAASDPTTGQSAVEAIRVPRTTARGSFRSPHATFPSRFVTVDLTAGTVDGRPCENLQFAEGLSPPYEIRYRNGANATGTYRLVVNASVANDGDYATTGSPSVSPAVYAATVEVTVQDPQLRYANHLDVARGKPDA